MVRWGLVDRDSAEVLVRRVNDPATLSVCSLPSGCLQRFKKGLHSLLIDRSHLLFLVVADKSTIGLVNDNPTDVRPSRTLDPMPPTPARILAFERQHPTATPDKHARIRHELGISEIRYHVPLEKAATCSEGVIADPITAREAPAGSTNQYWMRPPGRSLSPELGTPATYSLVRRTAAMRPGKSARAAMAIPRSAIRRTSWGVTLRI